ncbi:hypothetical protein [Aphanothece hegewaldii]|uniref:hypothetical protein n=1 Tax=Aphanothece hegewaldii TaxID=1521625 RepID=UPI0015E74584|nr:hypothetical protein [Aphanothece hegewaldii]
MSDESNFFLVSLQFSCYDSEQVQKLFQVLHNVGVQNQEAIIEDWMGSEGDGCTEPLYFVFLQNVKANIELFKQISGQVNAELSHLQETISSPVIYPD